MTSSDAPGPTTVRLTTVGPVATIELSRPGRLNALNRQLGDDLLGALSHLAADQKIRAIVLTGAGGNFCAGADLVDLEIDRLAELMTQLNEVVETLRSVPQPVVAKVRGAAVGAGCNLALASDFVVADETARFAEVFARIGLSPDLGGTWVLPRLVGLRQARELALLGDDITGTDAARIGLIHRCVPPDALERTVDELAGRLATRSRAAQARTKHLLDASWTTTLADALRREIDAQVANTANPEFHQAVSRFTTPHQGPQS